MAFLGWLGKSVPAIGNLGFSLGLSDRPVETELGTTPNPIPAIAGALTGNPALGMAGMAVSSQPLVNNNLLSSNFGQSSTGVNNMAMSPGDLSAKYLNYGLSMNQPAVAVPPSNTGMVENALSGLFGSQIQQAGLGSTIIPLAKNFLGNSVVGGTAGGVAGGVLGGVVQDMLPTGNITDSQVGGSGTLTPIGVLRLSSRGNLIITRSMKRKMKSLADTVGLVNGAQIVGISTQLASAILLKTFKTRERGVTGRELRKCRSVVNKMKHFYNMIPTRTTSTRRSTTVARGVTQIKN